MAPIDALPDWERLLAAERHLQYLVPGTVLVGGTAAGLHAGHRVSIDGDHVLSDLRERFDEVLTALEAVAGWTTERVQRSAPISSQLDGILTGVRQLRRTRPLETEEVAGLRIPTLAEMARIKAWLLVTRNTVRDYLDTVVLCERLGEHGVAQAMGSFDEIYRQPTQASTLAEVVERLAAAAPRDATEVDLHRYRALQPPWTDWTHVATRGQHWAETIARVVLDGNRLCPRHRSARGRCGTGTRSICAATRSWRKFSIAASWPIGVRCIGWRTTTRSSVRASIVSCGRCLCRSRISGWPHSPASARPWTSTRLCPTTTSPPRSEAATTRSKKRVNPRRARWRRRSRRRLTPNPKPR